jgi:hypothetical protein
MASRTVALRLETASPIIIIIIIIITTYQYNINIIYILLFINYINTVYIIIVFLISGDSWDKIRDPLYIRLVH